MIATKLDAKNQKTVYSYDAYNRVTEIQHFIYQNPFGPYVEDTSQQVLYSYNTNPYDTSGYSTNAAGRLTALKCQPMTNTFQQPPSLSLCAARSRREVLCIVSVGVGVGRRENNSASSQKSEFERLCRTMGSVRQAG